MGPSINPRWTQPGSLPAANAAATAPKPDGYAGRAPAREAALSGAPQPVSEAKKPWREAEWAAFGLEMLGGTLVLMGSGPVGLALAAIGGAGIVYAGYEGVLPR